METNRINDKELLKDLLIDMSELDMKLRKEGYNFFNAYKFDEIRMKLHGILGRLK